MSKHLESFPHLLYFCDFPPSNLRGGTVLLSRLLKEYPRDKITILTGSFFNRVSPAEGRLDCEQILLPTSDETGRWGIGRLKSLLQWMLVPFFAVYGWGAARRRRSRVILTVAHGHLFVAAALVSLFTGLPLILFVHDDWVSGSSISSIALKYFARGIFSFAARRASHVYTISPYMKEMLEREYGVKSEVQFPAIDVDSNVAAASEETAECLKLFYAGTGTGATADSFNMLLDLVKGSALEKHGIRSWELHLFIAASSEDVKRNGWEHERIKFHGWVTQEELRRELSKADILFLPFSFKEEQRYATEQAFPSKTADYLASGRPILVFAPAYSSVSRYAREQGFAEIVDEANEERLAEGIARICRSPEYRKDLNARARAALISNHNMQKQRDDFLRVVQQLTDEKRKASIPAPVRGV